MLSSISNPSSAAALTKDGIDALNAGDKRRARILLTEAVSIEPANEQAWLWLSGVLDTDAERLQCLERVLAINPHSEAAKHGLKMLGTVLAPAAPPTAPAAPGFPALPSIFTPSTDVVAPAAVATTATATVVTSPLPSTAYPLSALDPVFLRDRFLLRQKVSIAEKYHVWDDQNSPILFIERPRHMFRGLLAALATAIVGSILLVCGLVISSFLPRGVMQAVFLIPYVIAAVVASLAVLVMISKKRTTTFYRDETKREPLLRILQDNKFFLINANYTVHDATGEVLARLCKNHLYNILRKRWYCYAPDGSLMCVAKEDSVLRSVLRRAFSQLGLIGALFLPLLRTNFVIMAGSGTQITGMFNRKLTILDRYVLDMSPDTLKTVDRRVALALGVMLDTGERR